LTAAAEDTSPDRAWRELQHAEAARRRGEEGKARVSARRAAGWSLTAFYRKVTGQSPPRSALALLRWARDVPEISEPLRAAAGRLTVPVNTTHQLPHEQDPLDDARLLVTAFAGDTRAR